MAAKSQVVIVIALACVSGCDRLLGLSHISPHADGLPDVAYPDHVIDDPAGDFDGDGEPNATDLCPTIDNGRLGGTSDRDGDGVGDLCDPHPDTAGDCLVLFDDFTNEAALSPYWIGDGGAIFIGNAASMSFLQFFRSTEEIVSLTVPLDLDAVTVLGYVQEGDQGTQPVRAAVEVFVDLTLSQSPIAANGNPCAIESMGTATTVEQLATVSGTDSAVTTTTVGPERLGASTSFHLDWSPTIGTPAGCRAHVDDSTAMISNTAMVAAPMPASRTFAIRGINVGLEIYAIAGWGHSCPAH